MEDAGWQRSPGAEGCDLALVAGCVVTQRAERDVRKFLNRLRRVSPSAKVAAVGCYAERLARFPDHETPSDLNVPLRERARLPRHVEALFSESPLPDDPAESDAFFFVPTFKTQEKSRYFFKIQEGCDAVCAYCLVRQVRGPLSSLPLDRLLDHMRRLIEHGVREVVFCGTRLGRYGHDLEDGTSLARLAGALEALPGDFRWRFSSLEPWDLHRDLLEELGGAKRFCKFFHLPLQSGSDEVLKRMKRPYKAADYLRLIERVKKRFPGVRIGTDVIAGFPGETPREFEESAAFLSACPVDYLHVFPFSHRPGLGALPGAMPASEIKRRAGMLKELDAEKREIHRKNGTGRPAVALSIGARGILEDNLYSRFDPPQAAGGFIPCLVTGWEGAFARVQLKV